MRYLTVAMVLTVTCLLPIPGTAQTVIQASDLASVSGEWQGQLTYLDYSSDEPRTIPVELTVRLKKNKLVLSSRFPGEPGANSREKIKISRNGRRLDGALVKSREVLPTGDLRLVTAHQSRDHKQQASIRTTYILGNSRFIIRKEVRYTNAETWFMRNQYEFARPKTG